MNRAKRLYIITNSYPEEHAYFSGDEFEYALGNYTDIYIASFSSCKRGADRTVHLSAIKGVKEFLFVKNHKIRKGYIHLAKNVFDINLVELLKNIQSFFMAISLVKLTDINEFDLVFSYWLSRASRIAYYVHLLIGNRYICQGHGSDIYIYPPKNIREILNLSQKILTVGDKNKEYICRTWGMDEKTVQVFRLGVKEEFAKSIERQRECITKSPEKTIFLTVAGYRRVKGVDLLLAAVNQLAREKQLTQGIEFNIFGFGSEYDYYKKYIAENDLHTWVKLNNRIEREELAKMLATVDCYILPSRSEGLPVVLMEACAGALPIIATDVGSVREIALNGENAIVIEKENVEEIKEGVIRFLKLSLEERESMGKKSYAMFKTSYMLEENLKEKYDYLLNYLE